MAKKAMILKQQAKPKFSTRAYNRCKICGRPHAYLRDFGICRICFRELAYKGQIRAFARLPGKTCVDRKRQKAGAPAPAFRKSCRRVSARAVLLRFDGNESRIFLKNSHFGACQCAKNHAIISR